MRPPTDRQMELLALIADGFDQHMPPTIREMCRAMHVNSTNGVAEMLMALEAKELICRLPQRSRSIFLTDAGWQHVRRWRAETEQRAE
jgi:SOS-response transcriptional repressor LexA